MSHNFVNENGYNVCTHCGEAFKGHYWNKKQKINDIYKRITSIQTKSFRPNYKWNNLLFINKMFTLKTSSYIYGEIITILNLLPLNSKVKKTLYEYIMKKEITTLRRRNNKISYIDTCKIFYKLICKLDLPITSSEFFEILKIGRKHNFKPLTKLKNMDSFRKYYWYITKQIEKAQKLLNFSPEDAQRIYKIVWNYYNLIRFRMLKSSNPIYLIQNLVYYTIRNKLEPVQTKFNKRNFEIINTSYITSLVRYLQEIKVLKLDAKFTEKLKISKRNKTLISTL